MNKLFLAILLLSVSNPALAEGGLPQLDTTTYTSQIFWLFVSFALFYVLLSKVALPRISSVIESREKKISTDLDQATNLSEQAEDIKAAYEASLGDAHDKAHKLLRDTHDKLAQNAAREHAALTAKVQSMTAEHEEKIQKAKQKALAGIQEASSAIAVEAANKIARIAMNDNEANEAVEREMRKEVG